MRVPRARPDKARAVSQRQKLPRRGQAPARAEARGGQNFTKREVLPQPIVCTSSARHSVRRIAAFPVWRCPPAVRACRRRRSRRGRAAQRCTARFCAVCARALASARVCLRQRARTRFHHVCCRAAQLQAVGGARGGGKGQERVGRRLPGCRQRVRLVFACGSPRRRRRRRIRRLGPAWLGLASLCGACATRAPLPAPLPPALFRRARAPPRSLPGRRQRAEMTSTCTTGRRRFSRAR